LGGVTCVDAGPGDDRPGGNLRPGGRLRSGSIGVFAALATFYSLQEVLPNKRDLDLQLAAVKSRVARIENEGSGPHRALRHEYDRLERDLSARHAARFTASQGEQLESRVGRRIDELREDLKECESKVDALMSAVRGPLRH